MKLRLFALVCVACLVHPAGAAAKPQVVPLWNGSAPGSQNVTYAEQRYYSHRDRYVNVRNVVRPTLTVYLPDKATGAGVIVCPGGAFVNVGVNKEGKEVARWLNSIGVAAFVLKYRVAHSATLAEADYPTDASLRDAWWNRVQPAIPLAVADARQALRIVRARAAEWSLKPDRIGIMGFSAGGYLAIAAATQYDAASRPDFAAPIYPGVPDGLKVPADAPPLFLVHAEDDPYGRPIEGPFRLYTAWSNAHAPIEMHVYAKGGHGFALRRQGLPVDSWNLRFKDWLGSLGLLVPAPKPPR